MPNSGANIRLYTVASLPGGSTANRNIGIGPPTSAITRRNAAASLIARSTVSRSRSGT